MDLYEYELHFSWCAAADQRERRLLMMTRVLGDREITLIAVPRKHTLKAPAGRTLSHTLAPPDGGRQREAKNCAQNCTNTNQEKAQRMRQREITLAARLESKASGMFGRAL